MLQSITKYKNRTSYTGIIIVINHLENIIKLISLPYHYLPKYI
jgi:hypothetical protein